jgi:hypothetical protein
MTASDPPRKRGPRVSGPVVPPRREQRIERSSVVRRAGEVRGRQRPAAARLDAWAAVPDLAVPSGPTSAELDVTSAFAVPTESGDVRTLLDDVAVARRSLGDITYERGASPPTDGAAPGPAVLVPPELPPLPLETAPAVPAVPAVAPPTVAVPSVDAAAAPLAAAPVDEVVPGLPPRPRRSLFRRRTRVRRVSRVVRRVDAWSVLKVSAIFYALAYGVLLVAGVLLWNLAQTTGTVANIEGFVRELFGLREFTIDGDRLYRASWPIGIFLAVAGTGLNVTAAVMFNLITDLVGGVRVTVLEEEVRVVETTARRRRRITRSSVAVAPPADGPASQATEPEREAG